MSVGLSRSSDGPSRDPSKSNSPTIAPIDIADDSSTGDHTVMTAVLDAARVEFESGGWSGAYERLSTADLHEPLAPDDLERLAVAAQLVGEDEISANSWERAHLQLLEGGEIARAVRCAFWLASGLFSRDRRQHSVRGSAGDGVRGVGRRR